MFESLKKLAGNGRILTNTDDIKAIMSAVPLTENVSGLNEGDTILEITNVGVYEPKIGGQVMRSTVVLEAKTKSATGVVKVRPIYLSSLIRKIDINDEFKGMIKSDATFKDASDFDNTRWYDAFKKATPFHVAKLTIEPRKITRADGQQTVINSRELLLTKGEYGAASGTSTKANKTKDK